MSTRRSPILGPDGNPFEVPLLTEEVAAPTEWGVRALPSMSVATGLTPDRLAQILREANLGLGKPYLTLAMEMQERYMHYRSQLQVRRLAFDTVEPSVTAPEGCPTKIVDAVIDLVNDAGFRGACSELQDAVPKGYSVVEPIWDYHRGMMRPVRYKHRDPRFFQFDRITREELRLASDTDLDGVPIADGVFLRHLPSIETGLPLRRGLARPIAWAFIVQSFTLQDWTAFAEIYGIPFRVGRYGPSATFEDKRTLLRAVRNIANDGAAIIPTGMEFEFHSVSGNHGEAVFGELIRYLDQQVSKVVVGQTMTSDAGSSGSLAQAKVHNEVRLDIKRADGQQTAGTINRDLIPFFVAFNFGPQEVYPRVEFPVAEPEDIDALSKALERLVPLGLRVSQRQIRDKIALSEPEADDELLTPKAASSPPPAGPSEPAAPPARLSLRRGHPGGCRCAACATVRLAAQDPDRDAIDELQGEMLSDWEAVTDPLLEGMFALAADAGSYDEVLARLDALRIDSGPLVERLARATAISRGLGDVAD